LAGVPWHESPREIGVEFPQDYRHFVETYGSGSLSGDLGISMPWRAGGPPYLPEMEGFGLYAVRARNMSPLNQFHVDAPQRWPFAFWPEPSGLLPWARNPRYGYFFWHTTGAGPDTWTCVAWNQSEWRPYDCGMVELLLHLVNGADEFLSSFVLPARTPIEWRPNESWPTELPESLNIDDGDDWTIPAARAERGDDGSTWEQITRGLEERRSESPRLHRRDPEN
jgi:hypothetical protein